MTNKNALRAVMSGYGDTQQTLADYLEISLSRLNAKINGKANFTQQEIAAIARRYKLTAGQIDRIFFGRSASRHDAEVRV